MMRTSGMRFDVKSRAAWGHGWAVSVVVHVFLVGGIFFGLAQERVVEVKEVFQWNVQVVGRASLESPVPPLSQKRAASTRMAAHDRAAGGSQGAARALERVVAQGGPVSEGPRGVEQVAVAQSTAQPVVSEPVQREVRETVHATVMQTEADLVAAEVARVVRPSAMERESPTIIRRPDGSSTAVSEASDAGDLPPAGLATSADTAVRPQAVSAGIADGRAGAGGGADAESVASGEHFSKETVAAGGRSVADLLAQGQSQEKTNGGQQGLPPPAGSRGSSNQPDYGWLARVLRARIEEVKRYSLDAKRNEWEGQVVLTVSVQADGQIVDILVRTSSGNAGLDENARAIVAEVSPLRLPQLLGVSRVRLRIPLRFGLE